MMLATGSALAYLVDPVSPDEFIEHYWERRPLFANRERPNYFDGVFSFDALDELLARGDIWHPNIRVFLNGEQLQPSRFTLRWPYGREIHDRVVDREAILRLFRAGATVNVLGLERTLAPVMTLSKRLEVEAGFPVHTTAFLAPSEATNIPPHYDMVDVLVAQISGSKEWGLWAPDRTLPLTTDVTGRLYGPGDDRVAPERLLGRHMLHAGDMLYVPRGVLHEAVTTDEPSLHLAFGINPHRWYDLFEAIARRAVDRLAETVQLRQALPIGYHRRHRDGGEVECHPAMSTMTSAIASIAGGSLEVGLDALDEAYIQSRHPARPGQLAVFDRLDELTPSDRLVVPPELAYGIQRVGERLRLMFHHKTLTFGHELASALRFVAAGKPFAIDEIPDLSSERQLQFSQRLLGEGFLVLAKRDDIPGRPRDSGKAGFGTTSPSCGS